tara:strand:- start:646 stop:1737 length:1092 start_codon:yes stop_codon:yes gene_type:complete
VDNSGKLKHLSLCTGYGGIDIGLKRALGDISAVAYVEIEAFAVENLVAKIQSNLLDVAPIWTDLKTFSWSSFRGCVDIVSGGFPCQPFSTAGRGGGDEDPRHLWPYIVRGIKELNRPPVIFLENVAGIISSKLKSDQLADPEGTPILLHVLRELERLGYNATAGVFSAREVGAPHQRKRVFILACRSDLGKSGRDLVSRLLEWGGTMGHSESGPCYRFGWRGKSELPPIQVQVRESGTAYPAPRGAEQYTWEPTRVTVGNTTCRRQKPLELQSEILQKPYREKETGKPERSGCFNASNTSSKIESKVGGGAHGITDRLDYAELCKSLDNRTDELRLLGNGVVPATAERAFRVLWEELNADQNP